MKEAGIGVLIALIALGIASVGAKFWAKNKRYCEVDTVADMKSYDAFLEKNFTPIKSVFHEVVSDKEHIDLYILESDSTHPYSRIVTGGMRFFPMAIPAEIEGEVPERIELIMDLPPDWPLSKEAFEDTQNFWPIRVLKILAHFPETDQTWLGDGHTIPWDGAFDASTKLAGVWIVKPCQNPPWYTLHGTKEKVSFFQLVFIHEDEMNLKIEEGDDILRRHFKTQESRILNPARPSIIP